MKYVIKYILPSSALEARFRRLLTVKMKLNLLVWMNIGKNFNMETNCYRKIFILKMIFIIASHTDVCSGKTEFENRLMFRNLEVRDVDKNELYCDNNFQGISGHYTNIVLTKY